MIFFLCQEKLCGCLSDRFSSTKERILSQNKLIAKLSKFNYHNDISVTALLTVVMFCQHFVPILSVGNSC